MNFTFMNWRLTFFWLSDVSPFPRFWDDSKVKLNEVMMTDWECHMKQETKHTSQRLTDLLKKANGKQTPPLTKIRQIWRMGNNTVNSTHQLRVKLFLIASDVLFSKVSRSFQSQIEWGNDDRLEIPNEASRGSHPPIRIKLGQTKIWSNLT